MSATLYILGCRDDTAFVGATDRPLSEVIAEHGTGVGGCEEAGSPLLLFAESAPSLEAAEAARARLRALDIDAFNAFLRDPREIDWTVP